jgi:hypothetical protein
MHHRRSCLLTCTVVLLLSLLPAGSVAAELSNDARLDVQAASLAWPAGTALAAYTPHTAPPAGPHGPGIDTAAPDPAASARMRATDSHVAPRAGTYSSRPGQPRAPPRPA